MRWKEILDLMDSHLWCSHLASIIINYYLGAGRRNEGEIDFYLVAYLPQMV